MKLHCLTSWSIPALLLLAGPILSETASASDKCARFNLEVLPEIKRQYSHYKNCLPKIMSSIDHMAPTAVLAASYSIDRGQMDALAKDISQGLLDVMQFNRDAVGAFHLEASKITQRVLRKSFPMAGYISNPREGIVFSASPGHRLRVRFESGYSPDDIHQIMICQSSTSEKEGLTAERCLATQWLVRDLGIYRPQFESFNRISFYDPYVDPEGEMDLRMDAGCSRAPKRTSRV